MDSCPDWIRDGSEPSEPSDHVPSPDEGTVSNYPVFCTPWNKAVAAGSTGCAGTACLWMPGVTVACTRSASWSGVAC